MSFSPNEKISMLEEIGYAVKEETVNNTSAADGDYTMSAFVVYEKGELLPYDFSYKNQYSQINDIFDTEFSSLIKWMWGRNYTGIMEKKKENRD